MSRRRFFAPASAFDQKSVTLTGDEARHLREVLRLRPGDEVNVFDGVGNEFRCSVTSFGRDLVQLENCAEIEPYKPESPLRLTLAVALLKGEKFDLVVQKATELGVTAIVPVTTRHADIHLRDASDAEKRVTRWRRIALEAAKQSGRSVVPEIQMPLSFDSWIANVNDSVRLMFSERAGDNLKDAMSFEQVPETVSALVGSEGGWSDEEITTARECGWRLVTLGGRIPPG